MSNKGQFQKGMIPWNKNTKGIMKPNVGSFQKGRIAENKKLPLEKKCPKCNKIFYVKPSLARVVCCSKNCAMRGRETSEKQKLAVRQLRGAKHPRWIKDRNKLSRESKQGERRTSAYYYWRQQVWLRDNFTCKIANPDCSGKIEAHHILGWADYPELRYETNNGITLCHAHHPRRRTEEKRLSPYFQDLVSVSKKTF